MYKEILKNNILDVVTQPWFSPLDKVILRSGLSSDGRFINLKISPDDSSCAIAIFDVEGKPTNFVDRILESIPDRYREHLVTIKHDHNLSCSYVPVFDIYTQQVWDFELKSFLTCKQEWCAKFGCD